MFRNKKSIRSLPAILLGFILLLIPVNVGASSVLIPEEQIEENRVSYKTSEAVIGDISESMTAGVVPYYPKKTSQIYDGPAAVFVSFLPESRTAAVKKGDPLFTVSVVLDEVTLTEKQMALERETTSFTEGKASREEAIAALTEARDSLEDETEIGKMNLRIRISELQKEQYVYTQEKRLQELEEEIGLLKSYREPQVVYASADGVLSDVTYLSEGDPVNAGTKLCTITDSSVCLLKTTDSQYRDLSEYNYGQHVVINLSDASYTGIVTGASSVISNANVPFTIITLDEQELSGSIPQCRMEVSVLEIRNVLTIPFSARQLENGKTYVTVLGSDGQPHKRYIQTGYATEHGIWVLNGLSEGEKVIIN